ncbi:Peptidase M43B pregnancy-associated plasma-A [Niastella koreensis GR20-10]|uniref:Peptidase M43B pregnancy-associated plasma-A n=2 Tax=Niastella koreensis TaxID=354356 RepID=G8TCZ4_NIAKG|nr:Peptidase M43B pregnancy-associated plasma-A [Niastella koreensis GR20-10]
MGNGNFSWAQERQCGTMQLLEHTFQSNPSLKATFQKQTTGFQRSVNKRIATGTGLRIEGTIVYVPVVFHVVLTNPAVISDAQIVAQLDVLNKDFAGMNKDSVNLPAAFKPLFGKSQIQFKLAQRTPGNEPASGIVRATAGRSIYSTFDNSLKYTALGGDDAWDADRFLNVWITNLSAGYVLGYSTLPGASIPAEEGIVIHYTTLPADSLKPYNRGRTLTHEAGHFFYLYHIWGDENGCTGTDFVDDTPNQTTLTSGCPGGAIITDACSPAAPGILYENYMDYTDDACMSLFTRGQVSRMETALNDYHPGYYTSHGADPLPNLLSKGFMVTPNPATNAITIRFYPVPVTLKAISLYTSAGQKIAEQVATGAGSYTFNLNRFASGVYFIQAVFPDKKIMQKVIKQ